MQAMTGSDMLTALSTHYCHGDHIMASITQHEGMPPGQISSISQAKGCALLLLATSGGDGRAQEGECRSRDMQFFWCTFDGCGGLLLGV
eukprot:scaffold371775_cov34-Attheya_sp.AAC.1